jgi:tetratricopeptide (TPR) repeat protein
MPKETDAHPSAEAATAEVVVHTIMTPSQTVTTVGDALRLAVVHHNAGRLAEAMALYRLALRAHPDNTDAWRLLARAAAGSDAPALERSCLERLLALCPADPDGFAALSRLLIRTGETDRVLCPTGAAWRSDPLRLSTAFQWGLRLHASGLLERAASVFAHATLLAPNAGMVHINRGAALHAIGRSNEAERSLARGRRVMPDAMPGAVNSALVAIAEGRFADAIHHATRLIVSAPDSVQGYAALANALVQVGGARASVSAYDRGLRVEPDNAPLRLNRGIARLLDGELGSAWDDMAARWVVTSPPESAAYTALPVWDGRPLPDGRLLLWGEPGLGDEILFSGLVPDLVAAGIACTMTCDARLVPLLQRSLPEVRVCARVVPPEPADADVVVHRALGDLPGILRRAAGSFANQRPHLVADRSRVAELRAHLGVAGPRIGVSWRSAASGERSVPLDQLVAALQPVLAPIGGTLVSLQYGATADERAVAGVRHDSGVDPTTDVDGLAALMTGLDLIVTVDNTTAHLAGGLGIPGWVLLPVVPAWFWGWSGSGNRWYPGLRLFRQPGPGSWTPVLAEVTAALRGMMTSLADAASPHHPFNTTT